MNVKIFTLLFLSFLTPLNARYTKTKSIRSFKNAYTQAQNNAQPAKKKALREKDKLLKTENGKIFHKALINCKKNQNCDECETFIAASIELKKTDEYINDFLPIQRNHAYWHMRSKGLKSILNYIEQNPNDKDFENLYGAVYHALYKEFKPNIEVLTTREIVQDELYEMIKKENNLIMHHKNFGCCYHDDGSDIVNHFDKIERHIPKYR